MISGEEYAAWRETIFGEPYMVWHDGPSFGELAREFAEDPERVTELLAAGLTDQDSLAAESMRELDVTDAQRSRFVELLTEALPASSGSLQVEIGASLAALTEEDAWADEVVKVLDNTAEHWGVRLDAARRLAAVSPTPELADALARAVRDEDYLVRYHSASTLLTWAGRESSEPSDDRDLFPLISAEDSPDKWAEASALLRAEVERAF